MPRQFVPLRIASVSSNDYGEIILPHDRRYSYGSPRSAPGGVRCDGMSGGDRNRSMSLTVSRGALLRRASANASTQSLVGMLLSPDNDSREHGFAGSNYGNSRNDLTSYHDPGMIGFTESDEAEHDTDKRIYLSKEAVFILAAFVVLTTSGGLILGFGPVYSTLVDEEQWKELCPSSYSDHGTSKSCPQQEIHLQFVFATAFLCLSVANAVFGLLLDLVGPRWTAVAGLLLSLIGNLLFAAGDSTGAGAGVELIIGYSLIGMGGMGAFMASFQLLHLFETQGAVCSIMSSLFNCSGYVYMALRFDGVSKETFFTAYGIWASICLLICFLVFPTNGVTVPQDHLQIPALKWEMPSIQLPRGLLASMMVEVKRPDFIFFCLYFGWQSLVFAFAGGALPSLLSQYTSTSTSVALYTDVLYPLIVNGTFIYSPIVGFVIDHFGFKPVFAGGLLLIQLFLGLLLIPNANVQVFAFVVFAMAQSCVYALQFAYIMICFPAELYGTLQACLASVSFAFGLLNYLLNPLAQEVFQGDYTVVVCILAAPTVLFYFFLPLAHGCEEQTMSQKTRRDSAFPDACDIDDQHPTNETRALLTD